MKLVQKIGSEPQWKSSATPIEFSEVLEKFHLKRVKELEKLQWIN